jgi:hypothetical protein
MAAADDDNTKPHIVYVTFVGDTGRDPMSYEYNVDGWHAEEYQNADSVVADAIHAELFNRMVGNEIVRDTIIVVAYTYGVPAIHHDDPEHEGPRYECDVVAAISYDGEPFGVEHVGRVIMEY